VRDRVGRGEKRWMRMTIPLETRHERAFATISDGRRGGLRPTDLALGVVDQVGLQGPSDTRPCRFGVCCLDQRTAAQRLRIAPEAP
jgi:hypothetical protein